MQPLLVAYASTEGHTRKVAEFIAERLRIRGHRVDLVDTAGPAAAQVQPIYQGVLLGGSLHHDKLQGSLAAFIKANKPWLGVLPLGFFTVSLSAALPEAQGRAELEQAVQRFLAETGVQPVSTAQVAGAIRHAELDYFKRLLLRQVMARTGAGNDWRSDHEYTDWPQVEAFVDAYLRAAGIAG